MAAAVAVRWRIAGGVLLLAGAAGAAETPNAVPSRPQVEYILVEGKDCLQPIRHATDLTSQDYTDAAKRWLDGEYPGRRVPFWHTMLTLPSRGAEDADQPREPVHVVSYKATVDLGAGGVVRVCFDVNLTEPN